jgi:hypothetical protein
MENLAQKGAFIMTDMTEQTAYENAKKRVEDLKGFYGHLISYITVIGGLAAIDALTGGGWWFYWVAIPWGIGLVIHALMLFLVEGRLGRNWEERKVREYMGRDQSHGHA